MIATITGMYMKTEYKEVEQEGKKIKTPTILLASGDQVVKIPNIEFDEKITPGTFLDIACEVKLSEWEGRKYLSIRPIPQD